MSGMSVGQLVVIATLTAVLVAVSWQSVYLWLGVAHLACRRVSAPAISVPLPA
jgi:hypothetical protein